ncbi:MAG: hypothetical protein M3Q93_07500 [Gemmatimonadota bacterium]|nr:hypothetical protein [Gemmatimonadales bacterium]MDQ3137415.1 hypothetical protein [Gemmatimonadota bacterium]
MSLMLSMCRRWRSVALASGWAGLVACGGGDTAGPGVVEGSYTLRQLNDAALPYDHDGQGCCTYLAGTLLLDAAGYEFSLQSRNRNTALVFTATEWGKYAPQGSTVAFTADSFAEAPLGLDLGTVSGDSVRVLFGGEGPGSPDQFSGLFVPSP